MRKFLESIAGLVPPRFELIRRGSSHLAIRRDAGERLRQLALAEPAARGGDDDDYRGRGQTQRVVYDSDGPRRAIFRRYRRGGAFRWLTRDKLFQAARPFRELDVVERARTRGVPTVDVLAVRVDRVAPFIYKGEMVTAELEDAPDLVTWLERPDAPSGRARREAVEMIGRVVAGLHGAGVKHADLHLKNLLLRGGSPPEVFVIDLDRGVRKERLTARERFANLRRLDRSTVKFNLLSGPAVSRTDRVRALRAYLATFGSNTAGGAATTLRDVIRRWPPGYGWRRFKWTLLKRLKGPQGDPSERAAG